MEGSRSRNKDKPGIGYQNPCSSLLYGYALFLPAEFKSGGWMAAPHLNLLKVHALAKTGWCKGAQSACSWECAARHQSPCHGTHLACALSVCMRVCYMYVHTCVVICL